MSFSLLASTVLAENQSVPTPEKVARPPQYIMIGFDGGLDLRQWQATRDFAADMTKNNKPVKFTYFISGVYFLRQANRHFYAPPKHDVGYSNIGFGESAMGIASRLNMMNDAYAEGHEIASRGNGQFDGARENWDTNDWDSEFKQFNDLVFGAYFNNGLTPSSKYPQGYALGEKDVVGFRAPRLGVNEALWQTMKAMNFRYDVSVPGASTLWPTKNKYGFWNITLPMIEMAGTGKLIIGMDYNFYYVHSKAKEDLANREHYRKEMLDSYMNYFNMNYYGRRAPVSLGHNFEKYNGGAYWDALQDFVKNVCGMPEVKCVSYKQYADWLDTLTPEILTSYKLGQFDLLPRPRRPNIQ
ncbi:hypothetical protein [Bdellovibrio sp. HCB-162]|uniref:hypothetical protein n=1 Tax=Bdellovibrio sp. HCB-162 TaxID=3394234 RepID=UPI0039BC96FF